ncbi:MAG: hypothetical protein KME10_02715 [Plectolyngbya sp. WJT66-NPBG17]|nr:hypothetical protein [Plectolyngbya sp. WJT66-NPBG17]
MNNDLVEKSLYPETYIRFWGTVQQQEQKARSHNTKASGDVIRMRDEQLSPSKLFGHLKGGHDATQNSCFSHWW